MFEEIGNGFQVRLFKEKAGNVGDKVTDKVTDNQKKIINALLSDNRISTSQLSDNIGISQRKIKENISKLKELCILERIGPAKGGYWKVND